ncbi:unnamed protein product [Linum trigynum]|uniref:Uncharacterized protein n=1 Tax=Linum trigynum TaxID=586398 RepID=A0AAV2D6S1_9ROSI
MPKPGPPDPCTPLVLGGSGLANRRIGWRSSGQEQRHVSDPLRGSKNAARRSGFGAWIAERNGRERSAPRDAETASGGSGFCYGKITRPPLKGAV